MNQQALSYIGGVVMTVYLDLLAARDSTNQHDIPVFVHSYDFVRPSGKGVCGGLKGPWLFPSLQSRGWMKTTGTADMAKGAAIVKLVLVEFERQMRALAADPRNNVVYVETQGPLGAGYWANELHPKPSGFKSIAQKFATALAAKLNSRSGPRARLVRRRPLMSK